MTWQTANREFLHKCIIFIVVVLKAHPFSVLSPLPLPCSRITLNKVVQVCIFEEKEFRVAAAFGNTSDKTNVLLQRVLLFIPNSLQDAARQPR